jgi:hypothetical protein
MADSWVGNIHYKIVAGAGETTVWTNDKPYVIYGWAAVDSLGKLIIEPGTRVYLHNGSGIWVYRFGNIHVNGTQEQPVLFRGDRLESWYNTDYAQWDRIWINEGSAENVIQHAIITNAYTEYNRILKKHATIKIPSDIPSNKTLPRLRCWRWQVH